jgi:hypothetical protein
LNPEAKFPKVKGALTRMKAQISEDLKSDVPQTKWGKILLATPVVMTVIATMLAGLSSSEMTRAQYDRSLAAQLQSKAGDQWGYFQAKKMRGAMQRSTLEVLQSTTQVHPFTLPSGGEVDPASLAALQHATLPDAPAWTPEPAVKAALEAVETSKPETEIAALLKPVKEKELAAALTAARERTLAFDAALKPVNQSLDALEKTLSASSASVEATRDFTAAHLRFAAARYDAEAKLNQTIANVLELQVRKSNISAERHFRRSGKFFYGMLAAQMAVIIATFSIAARKRTFLWTAAAVAGLAAVAFAAYVYFYV